MVNIASLFVAADNRLLQHLERDSEWLQQQLGQYGPISSNYVTKFAYETYETPTVLGRSIYVVPRASAVVPGSADAESIAIHANHIEMVKFESKLNQGYRSVSGHMQLMVLQAEGVVRQRWDAEEKVNAFRTFTPLQSHTISASEKRYSAGTNGQAQLCVIPFSRNRNFTGRQSDLSTLQRKLFEPRGCEKIALVGLGGVGKTQIALQFAYMIKEKKPDHSIFWIAALSIESFKQGCIKILKAAQKAPAEDEDLIECFHHYLWSRHTGSWLLIIDNADDVEMLDGLLNKYGGISEFFATPEHGSILFTSRHREAARSLAGTEVVEIQQMDPGDARNLLETSLPMLSALGNNEEISMLLEELAFHPLAITQAAAYLDTKRVFVFDYLRLLRGTKTDMFGVLSRNFRDNTRYAGAANAVAMTWLVSFEQIERSDPPAAELLAFLSQIEHRAIPVSLLPDPKSEKTISSLGTLCSYAFVSRCESGSMYNMHRLVHLASQIWVEESGRKEVVCKMATVHLENAFPSSDFVNRTLWRECLPHAIRVANDNQTQSLEEQYRLCFKMGRCLYEDRRTADSIAWLLKAYRWRLEQLGEKHQSTLASQHELASAYLEDGQVAEAVKLLKSVVAIREATLAEEHPHRLASQHELASAYLIGGQVAEAVKLLKYVVAVKETMLAEKHPSRLASQHELARAYLADGQVIEAIKLLNHIVIVEEKMLAEERPDRLVSQRVLASAYLADGQVAEAVKLLKHIVIVEEAILAEEHPDRLASQHALASAYLADGQVAKAVKLLEYVVAKREMLAEEHPDRLASQHELACAYLADRQVAKAVKLLEYVVAKREMLAEEHPDRLVSQYALACAYLADGQVAKSVKLLRRVVQIEERCLRHSHPSREVSQQLFEDFLSLAT